jgi:hypothetical protein
MGHQFSKQFVRQTGGARGVVSLYAKLDADGVLVHDSLPYRCTIGNNAPLGHVLDGRALFGAAKVANTTRLD